MEYQIIPVTSLHQNCTLLWCKQSAHAAVIDPGGEAKQLITLITAHSLNLTQILLTHGHVDHVGAAAELADHFRVPIRGPHAADHFLLATLPLQSQFFCLERTEPLQPTQWLQEGETVVVGQQTFTVLHCPGHTPGHIIFFNRTLRLAWVGDVLFHKSIGRTDLPGGDLETLVSSIHSKLWPLGDDIMFIPGHGPTSTFGHERVHNLYLQPQ